MLSFRFIGAAFSHVFALSCPSGSTAVLSGSTVEARQAVVPLPSGSTALGVVVPLVVFGRSTVVVPGYYRLDSRLLFFVSGFTVLSAVVEAVVPLQAVVPRLLPR